MTANGSPFPMLVVEIAAPSTPKLPRNSISLARLLRELVGPHAFDEHKMIPRAPIARSSQLYNPDGRRLFLFSPRLDSQATARRWKCQDCRQRARATLLFSAQDRLSPNRPGFDRTSTRSGRLTDSLSTNRFFSIARRMQANGARTENSASKDGSAAAPQDETFDERVGRLVERTRCAWNELVGYTDIEKERKRVEMQEETIEQKRLELQEARDAYRSAVDKHAASLRESRDLLGRRDEWSESDAARFAALHTMVKTNENIEYGTRQALQAAELGLEREIERLSSKIGAVYQAESMYNSKILQMKTWWTWALFIFNGSVFVFNLYLLQVGLNPRSKNAEIVLADDTIKKLSSKLAESVAVASSKPDNKSLVMHNEAPTELAFGPLSIQNGSVFYKDSELEVKPHDTVFDIKESIQAVENISSAKLRLFMNSVELDNSQSIQDFPMDLRHAIEVFAVDLQDSEVGSLATSAASHLRSDSFQDSVKILLSDQQISLQMRDVTFAVIQSALAGAAMASLVVIGLGRG